MKIITISGLDGSGKSTQIKLLKKQLETSGYRVFYFHAIDFSIGNKIIFWKHKKNKRSNVGVTKTSWINIQLRKIALQVDIWRFAKLVKKLEKQNCDYILSDRFFYDVVINIEYLSQQIKNNLHKITSIDNSRANKINYLLSTTSCLLTSIYLQTDPITIMNRSKEAPSQGLQFLKDKKKLYNAKIGAWDWQVINNTNLTKEETANAIWEMLNN